MPLQSFANNSLKGACYEILTNTNHYLCCYHYYMDMVRLIKKSNRAPVALSLISYVITINHFFKSFVSLKVPSQKVTL